MYMTSEQDQAAVATGHPTLTDARLKELFSEVFEIDPDSVEPDTSPENLDEWDSFGHMRLIMAVEKAFGLTLTMAQISKIESFATLRATILEAD